MNTYRVFNDQGITISGEDGPAGHPPDELYEIVETHMQKYQNRIDVLLSDWRDDISFRRHAAAAERMKKVQELLVKMEALTDWTVHVRYADTDRHGNSYSAVHMAGWEFLPHKLVSKDIKQAVWLRQGVYR